MRHVLSLSFSSTLVHYLIIASAFVLPFLLGSSQIVTGILVNTALIVSALRLGKEIRFSWIILPSVAALARGLVFGPMTPYLYYFLPLIWISNWCFSSILSLRTEKIPMIVRFSTAACIKIMILYGSSYVLTSLKIVPSIFRESMGMMQAATLIGGGIGAYFILHVWTPNQKK